MPRGLNAPALNVETRFTCSSSIARPGGEAFGASTLARMARSLSEREVIAARFLRNPAGGWMVIIEIGN